MEPRPPTASRHSEGVTRPLSRCGRRRFVVPNGGNVGGTQQRGQTQAGESQPQPQQQQQSQGGGGASTQEDRQKDDAGEQKSSESQRDQQQTQGEGQGQGGDKQQQNNAATLSGGAAGLRGNHQPVLPSGSGRASSAHCISSGTSVSPHMGTIVESGRTPQHSSSAGGRRSMDSTSGHAAVPAPPTAAAPTGSRQAPLPDTHGYLLSRRHRRFHSMDTEHGLEWDVAGRSDRHPSSSGSGPTRHHPDSGYSSLWSRPDSEFSVDLDIRSVASPENERYSELVSERRHPGPAAPAPAAQYRTRRGAGREVPVGKTLSDPTTKTTTGKQKIGRYSQPLPNIHQPKAYMEASSRAEDGVATSSSSSSSQGRASKSNAKYDTNSSSSTKEKGGKSSQTKAATSKQQKTVSSNRKKSKDSSMTSTKGRSNGQVKPPGRGGVNREPDMKEPHVTLAIRLPDGKRLQRRFNPMDSLRQIMQYAAANCSGYELTGSGYQIVTSTAPQQVYKDMRLRVTDTEIEDRTLIHVQAVPED